MSGSRAPIAPRRAARVAVAAGVGAITVLLFAGFDWHRVRRRALTTFREAAGHGR
ncbi:hypothetical protein L1856_23775 [Streptomyces sp. Tue 6430]|nr:hypothetical protein [Streptomyces sp. Tue 6430]